MNAGRERGWYHSTWPGPASAPVGLLGGLAGPQVDGRQLVQTEKLRDLSGVERVVAAHAVEDGGATVARRPGVGDANRRRIEIVQGPPIEAVAHDAPGRVERSGELLARAWMSQVVLPAQLVGRCERRALAAWFFEHAAQPIHAGSGHVGSQRPNGGMLGTSSQGQLVRRQVLDRITNARCV